MEQWIRRSIYVVFIAILGVLFSLGYKANKNRLLLVGQISDIRKEVESIKSDNDALYKKIDYFSDPHNLEKELRARFNYRLPGEKLIIVVPEQNNSSSTNE